MNFENFIKIIDQLPADTLVQPNLYGEPLLIPNFMETFSAMKRRGLRVAMNTNGLTLNDKLAAFLVDTEIDSISFSLDAVSRETLKAIRGIDKLEKIEASVFGLLAKRGARKYPRIGVSFTLQDANRHEHQEFLDRWVGFVDVVRVGLIFENGHFPEMKKPEKRIPCSTLYNTLPIHNNGDVSICCLDGLRNTNMGNVLTDGVDGVWNGDAFVAARKAHEEERWDDVPFCKSCNGWAWDIYEEELRDNILIRKSPQMTYYNLIDRLDNWKGYVQ